jgi:hypothetical protein
MSIAKQDKSVQNPSRKIRLHLTLKMFQKSRFIISNFFLQILRFEVINRDFGDKF